MRTWAAESARLSRGAIDDLLGKVAGLHGDLERQGRDASALLRSQRAVVAVWATRWGDRERARGALRVWARAEAVGRRMDTAAERVRARARRACFATAWALWRAVLRRARLGRRAAQLWLALQARRLAGAVRLWGLAAREAAWAEEVVSGRSQLARGRSRLLLLHQLRTWRAWRELKAIRTAETSPNKRGKIVAY